MTPNGRQMIARGASVATIWIVNSLLKLPPAKKITSRFEETVDDAQETVQRKGKRALRNATRHPLMLAGGFVALAAAITLFTIAARDETPRR